MENKGFQPLRLDRRFNKNLRFPDPKLVPLGAPTGQNRNWLKAGLNAWKAEGS